MANWSLNKNEEASAVNAINEAANAQELDRIFNHLDDLYGTDYFLEVPSIVAALLESPHATPYLKYQAAFAIHENWKQWSGSEQMLVLITLQDKIALDPNFLYKHLLDDPTSFWPREVDSDALIELITHPDQTDIGLWILYQEFSDKEFFGLEHALAFLEHTYDECIDALESAFDEYGHAAKFCVAYAEKKHLMYNIDAFWDAFKLNVHEWSSEEWNSVRSVIMANMGPKYPYRNQILDISYADTLDGDGYDDDEDKLDEDLDFENSDLEDEILVKLDKEFEEREAGYDSFRDSDDDYRQRTSD